MARSLRGEGHRRHHSDLGFRFPDLRDFAHLHLADNLFHRRRREPQHHSQGRHPHWRYVPPPFCYDPPPPPPPSPYAPHYSPFTRHSAPSQRKMEVVTPQHTRRTQSSAVVKTPAPSAPSVDEASWFTKTSVTPTAPPSDQV